EPERTRGEHQVCALKRGVAEGISRAQFLASREPAARVGMREEPRQLLVEFEIHAHDHADRRAGDLGLVLLHGVASEARLGVRRLAPDQASGELVGRRWAELHQVPDRMDLFFADVAIEPGVIAARLSEQLVESMVAERLAAHAARTSLTSGT